MNDESVEHASTHTDGDTYRTVADAQTPLAQLENQLRCELELAQERLDGSSHALQSFQLSPDLPAAQLTEVVTLTGQRAKDRMLVSCLSGLLRGHDAGTVSRAMRETKVVKERYSVAPYNLPLNERILAELELIVRPGKQQRYSGTRQVEQASRGNQFAAIELILGEQARRSVILTLEELTHGHLKLVEHAERIAAEKAQREAAQRAERLASVQRASAKADVTNAAALLNFG